MLTADLPRRNLMGPVARVNADSSKHGLDPDAPGHDGQCPGLPFAKFAHRKYPAPDHIRPWTPVGLPINPARPAAVPDDRPLHADDAGFAFAPEHFRPPLPGHRLVFPFQNPEIPLRGPQRPPLATARLVRKKCVMADSPSLQTHKKAVRAFLALVNAGNSPHPF